LAGPDGIRPVDERFPDVADQVWLRANALSPWLIDVLLNPDQHGVWVNRRDRSMVAPLDNTQRATVRGHVHRHHPEHEWLTLMDDIARAPRTMRPMRSIVRS
jgi:hypothetical protein